jgi:hypothetical protein
MQGGVSGFRKHPPPPETGGISVRFSLHLLIFFSRAELIRTATSPSPPIAENAPVNRAIVLTSGLLSVVFSAQRRSRALGISYQVGLGAQILQPM